MADSDQEVHEELAAILEMLVDEPEALELEAERDDSSTVFHVSLPSNELGKIIGRQGRTARALRTLLTARGGHEGRRYALEIQES
jgi:predicted RNA-binding protein YlqC (UPF0109 family)